MEGKFGLCSLQNTLKIAPVLPDDQAADEAAADQTAADQAGADAAADQAAADQAAEGAEGTQQ